MASMKGTLGVTPPRVKLRGHGSSTEGMLAATKVQDGAARRQSSQPVPGPQRSGGSGPSAKPEIEIPPIDKDEIKALLDLANYVQGGMAEIENSNSVSSTGSDIDAWTEYAGWVAKRSVKSTSVKNAVYNKRYFVLAKKNLRGSSLQLDGQPCCFIYYYKTDKLTKSTMKAKGKTIVITRDAFLKEEGALGLSIWNRNFDSDDGPKALANINLKDAEERNEWAEHLDYNIRLCKRRCIEKSMKLITSHLGFKNAICDLKRIEKTIGERHKLDRAFRRLEGAVDSLETKRAYMRQVRLDSEERAANDDDDDDDERGASISEKGESPTLKSAVPPLGTADVEGVRIEVTKSAAVPQYLPRTRSNTTMSGTTGRRSADIGKLSVRQSLQVPSSHKRESDPRQPRSRSATVTTDLANFNKLFVGGKKKIGGGRVRARKKGKRFSQVNEVD